MSLRLGRALFYGVVPEKPKLPDGWRYYERPGHWLIAESPDGRFWFAGQKEFIRLRFANQWDVISSQFRALFNKWIEPFDEGDIIADPRNIIYLYEQEKET